MFLVDLNCLNTYVHENINDRDLISVQAYGRPNTPLLHRVFTYSNI